MCQPTSARESVLNNAPMGAASQHPLGGNLACRKDLQTGLAARPRNSQARAGSSSNACRPVSGRADGERANNRSCSFLPQFAADILGALDRRPQRSPARIFFPVEIIDHRIATFPRTPGRPRAKRLTTAVEAMVAATLRDRWLAPEAPPLAPIVGKNPRFARRAVEQPLPGRCQNPCSSR